MPIKYRCPECGQKIKISSRYGGRSLDCPKCGTKTKVPAKEAILKRRHKDLHPERYITTESEEPAFELRRRTSSDDEMDLTPMVDVTFQLLIFFIFTASMSLQKSIEVPTPDRKDKGAQQAPIDLEDIKDNSIIVEIQGDNSIFVDDEELQDRNELAGILSQQMLDTGNSEMLINANEDSFHETIVAVYDAANEVGMQKIRLVTVSGSGDE